MKGKITHKDGEERIYFSSNRHLCTLCLIITKSGSYHHPCTWIWSTRTLDPTYPCTWVWSSRTLDPGLPSSLYLGLVNTNFGSWPTVILVPGFGHHELWILAYRHPCTWVWSTRILDPTVILVPGFGQYELWILPSFLYLGLVNTTFGTYRHPCNWVWSIRTLDPTIILVPGFAQHDLWILSSSLYLGLVKTKSGSPRTTDFPRARVTMPCAPSGQSPWGDLQRPPSLLPLPLSTLGCVTARPLAGAVWEVSLVRSWASRGHLLALSPDSNR
ncbi:hypothetical protein RRG08_027422 [Elysia crispata]|uniref:Uncharacterized protein n=1 Tax=Elysia crispata TaxID=231223 RepID=A0AAE0YFB1_9GAST|nr:hypothetical protein RRG08_027422 [Elysia crispata]